MPFPMPIVVLGIAALCTISCWSLGLRLGLRRRPWEDDAEAEA